LHSARLPRIRGRLAAWSPDPNGTQVQIYSIIPGNFITGGGSLALLASAVVTPTDPEEGSPTEFYSQAITPVTLAADVGTDATYYIIQYVGPNDSVETTPYDGVTSDPSINFGYAVAGLGGYPTEDIEEGAFGRAYFGPDFDIGPSTPEPASILTLAGGLALLAFFRHRAVSR
jgi:hypothetical protein